MLEKDNSITTLNGKKLSKAEPIFEVLGDLDELIALLGIIRSFSAAKSEKLGKIQKELIQVGAFLANKRDDSFLDELISKTKKKIDKEKIDLNHFVIPKKKVESFVHLARVKTRQLERATVRLESKQLDKLICYFNLLSQYLFWIAVN